MEALESTRFHELLHDHKAAIANYLRRRLHPLPKADLDDLVEETLIIVWRRIHDVPSGDGARPWIIGVARNVLHNAQRSHRRRRHREAHVGVERASSSAEDVAIADLNGRSAMAALGSQEREILTLHFWDGLDIDALSITLGITSNTAGTRLSRAKARFLELVTSFDRAGTSAPSPDIHK